METKKVLNLLTNQYFKSLKRFENVYRFMPNFNKQVNDFNSNFLKLISAVLNSTNALIRALIRIYAHTHTHTYTYAYAHTHTCVFFNIYI